MIKKLRRSFIVTSMISVIVVLAAIVAAINIINYANSANEADTLLHYLSDNGGSFGAGFRGAAERQSDDGAEPPEPPEGGFSPDMMRKDRERGFMTAETPYETRFFTVVLKDNGDPVTIDTGKIAAVSSEEALTLAQTLFSQNRESGYSGNFRYLITRQTDNNLCVFVDRSRALWSIRDFVLISVLVSLGAAAAIFVLIFILSGAVIRPAAESYEKQKKFITDAGHELKTPLAVINSCTEVIEMEQGESKWTKGIAAQTERLATLTKELVALARMDESGAKPNFEVFSLSETVTEILDPFVIPAELKGVTLTTEIMPDISFKGDKGLIAKLCSILADNAVKYTPEGGNIVFTLTKKGKRICIVSENTANGMEKGAHPEFFDRFRRGDVSRNSDTPGYGIGLSMAQSIVQAHGGRIDAVSKDGESFTITVRL